MTRLLLAASRELRRVPLDFDHPIDEVWEGYLLPTELGLPNCAHCKGGWSAEARKLIDSFYDHQVGPGETSWCREITEEEIAAFVAEGTLPLGTTPESYRQEDERPNGMQLGRITRMFARCEALGITPECSYCGGTGTGGTAEQKAAHDAWKDYDPPVGDGYQMWETVSEGSPQSPVFADEKSLCDWLAENADAPGGQKLTAGEWARMLNCPYPLIDVHTNELLVTGGDCS